MCPASAASTHHLPLTENKKTIRLMVYFIAWVQGDIIIYVLYTHALLQSWQDFVFIRRKYCGRFLWFCNDTHVIFDAEILLLNNPRTNIKKKFLSQSLQRLYIYIAEPINVRLKHFKITAIHYIVTLFSLWFS